MPVAVLFCRALRSDRRSVNIFFVVRCEIVDIAGTGTMDTTLDRVFVPAQARAHLRDIVMVAHEKLVVVNIIHVVRVHDVVFIRASERESRACGANVRPAWVQGTEFFLHQRWAAVTAILRRLDNVARALLLGTREACACSAAGAGLVASAPL